MSTSYSLSDVRASEDLRGENLLSAVDTHLWSHEIRDLSPAELRIKQLMWDFFRNMSPERLQMALTIYDPAWVACVIGMETEIQSKQRGGEEDGLFFDMEGREWDGGPFLAGASSSEREAHASGRFRQRSLPGSVGLVQIQ